MFRNWASVKWQSIPVQPKCDTTNTTRAMCVKIVWKRCEKCVKKRNHVKSMLEKIQVHHISISHACELFDMRVKFCNTCEKFLSYVWTFFPCILLHVKSFHTCETILSCMWTSNFTCIIDVMLVKFFTCMWTLLGMSEWACEFFSGLVKCNHHEPYFYENAMNFWWIPHERHFMAHKNCKIKFHAMPHLAFYGS